MSDIKQYKKLVRETAQKLASEKYLVGSGGNISVLVEGKDLVAITPSSMDYLDLADDDICVVDLDKNVVEGEHRPSLETGMHLEVYKKRPDVNVVIHTHQVYPSVFALIGEPIPAIFDEQVANLGDKIDVVPYGLSGSEDLLNNIGAAVANNCNAFILQNHGALLLGLNMEKAVINVKLLDKVAQSYYLALAMGRDVTPLPENVTALVFALMKNHQKQEIERKGGAA